jgi:hypothetical protein
MLEVAAIVTIDNGTRALVVGSAKIFPIVLSKWLTEIPGTALRLEGVTPTSSPQAIHSTMRAT